MAWDLRSSSYYQVAYDGNYSQRLEWQFDDYFGCGYDFVDVMEEDALNEESCVQVLRVLITKADTEIEELEKDLLSLQNELAWAEHEKWSEICCSALIERINWLDVAVCTLKKNDCSDDTEMQVLFSSKPAETLHEIVKALQRDQCQEKHGQHLDENILNPIVNIPEHALDKDFSNIDSNIIMKEEGKELCGTSENSTSSELVLEFHEKKSDDPEKIEELLAKSLVRSPDLWNIRRAPDHSDGLKSSETLDIKVAGNEKEARRSQLINTDTGQILNSFSSKGNGNTPSEAKKDNTIVKDKDVSSDDFRLVTGIKGRKNHPHSRLGTSQQQKGGSSDLDKELCDFAPKTARKGCKKESKVAPDEDLESMTLQVVHPQKLCPADTELCSIEGSDGNNSLQVMNIENATLIHAEDSALISLLGMQTKSALYTGLELTDEEKPQAQDLKSKIAANLSMSMNSPSKLKAQGKQTPELEAFSATEPLDSPTDVIPRTSIIVSTKRQRKSKICTDGAISNESMNKKITRRDVQPGQHETEGGAIVLYDSKFSELQKKRRISTLPITVEIQNSTVNLDIPNSDGVSMNSGNQVELHVSKSYSLVDSHNGTSALLPINLKNLTLSNLRAMAKQHNVRKYYKLPKGALVELLVERLSSC